MLTTCIVYNMVYSRVIDPMLTFSLIFYLKYMGAIWNSGIIIEFVLYMTQYDGAAVYL